ncbi:hypothetical protein [Falsiroseomonas sp. HW251]|uniref:hypothetical protein n=1 Tax=Falsiroseomonas sp. HW251 TaxID=3390998 RepID=UPI003D322EB4
MSGRALGAAAMLPPVAWFLFQQGLGLVVRIACERGGPPIGPAIGAAALLLCAGAAWIGWRGLRTGGAETQALLAGLALGCAGAFGLAIAFQLAATVIEAPCFR